MPNITIHISKNISFEVNVSELDTLLDVIKKIQRHPLAKGIPLTTYKFSENSKLLTQKQLNINFQKLSNDFTPVTLTAFDIPGIQSEYNLSQEVTAKATIKNWLTRQLRKKPERTQVQDILNGHEADIGPFIFNDKERKAFLEEIHNNHYDLIAERSNAFRLALWARKRNKINSAQLHNIHELSEAIRLHGFDNVKIFKIIDDKGNLTVRTCSLLRNCFDENFKKQKNGIISLGPILDPARVTAGKSPEEAYLAFVDSIRTALSPLEQYANLQYVITSKAVEATDDSYKDFLEYGLFEAEALLYYAKIDPIDSENRTVKASYICHAAREILGSRIHPKTWWSTEMRIGPVTTLTGIENPGLRHIRPMSVSCDKVALPKTTHNVLISPEGYRRHDEYHRVLAIHFHSSVLNAITRMKLIVRKHTNIMWFNALWDWTDLEYGSQGDVLHDTPTQLLSQFLKTALKRTERQLLMWMLVKDIVDNYDLWTKNSLLRFDIDAADFIYNKQIQLYRALNQFSDFSRLEIKQQLFILDKIHVLATARSKIPSYPILWEQFKKDSGIPSVSSLSFVKAGKKDLPAFPNAVYLQYQRPYLHYAKQYFKELHQLKDFKTIPYQLSESIINPLLPKEIQIRDLIFIFKKMIDATKTSKDQEDILRKSTKGIFWYVMALEQDNVHPSNNDLYNKVIVHIEKQLTEYKISKELFFEKGVFSGGKIFGRSVTATLLQKSAIDEPRAGSLLNIRFPFWRNSTTFIEEAERSPSVVARPA